MVWWGSRYLRAQNPKRTTAQDRTLQERTFYGKEKKSLAYVIAIMNMILHGIEAPNIIHTNPLAENLADVQEKDRFHTREGGSIQIRIDPLQWERTTVIAPCWTPSRILGQTVTIFSNSLCANVSVRIACVLPSYFGKSSRPARAA